MNTQCGRCLSSTFKLIVETNPKMGCVFCTGKRLHIERKIFSTDLGAAIHNFIRLEDNPPSLKTIWL